MKQTVCLVYYGLIEQVGTEEHIPQNKHVTQMSLVKPSECTTTTGSQLTDCMQAEGVRGWGGCYETHQDHRQ